MSAPAPVIAVQVRELVDFVWRRGDLGSDRDFVGSKRALAGTRGHQQVQRSRPAGYQKEVRVTYDVPGAAFTLRVQGRIDGVLTTGTEVLLEEIKTVQGAWDGQPDPLHWAQLKIYAFVYTHDHPLDHLDLQLVYLNLTSGALTDFQQSFTRAELADFFQRTTSIYLEWLEAHQERCRDRDRSIAALDFPFRQYRPGQRELAIAAYRAVSREERLFLEAPTGIGKTISVLFPALKAMAEGKLERVFYLTARTTARAVAENALEEMRRNGLRLRSLTLTAKEKICVRAGQPCDIQTCPLAAGYYDRNKGAMRAALASESLTRPRLEAVGNEHQVCPFALGLDLSSWVDVVICDYNHAFDPQACLHQHFTGDSPNHLFLIDEAHNLVDRAREIFSAEVGCSDIDPVRRSIQATVPRAAKALSKLSAALRKLCRIADDEAARSALDSAPADAQPQHSELDLFSPSPPAGKAQPTASPRPRAGSDEKAEDRACHELPATLKNLTEGALEEMESWLSRHEPAEFRAAMLELYFKLFSFARTAESYDERYRTLLHAQGSPRVQLFCLDPSFLLQEALQRAKAAIFFSATLTPLEYYRELLGGRAADPVLQLPSPFPPENLAVLVHDAVRTGFKDRAHSLSAVAESIGELVSEQGGNYLVYFPSYQYLTAVLQVFQQLWPQIPVIVQRPGMSEAEREQFLNAFVADRSRTQVGFALMGGIFGEGIDLVGDRLIGAVIVGVGLPQLCLERDLIREYFQEKLGHGFEYAYLFPGMNRVLQAAGRVIRSEADRGTILLADVRFGEMRYRRLFPAWWQPRRVRTRDQLRATARQFWADAAAARDGARA